jgi:preprotein translocase subunit SecG
MLSAFVFVFVFVVVVVVVMVVVIVSGNSSGSEHGEGRAEITEQGNISNYLDYSLRTLHLLDQESKHRANIKV